MNREILFRGKREDHNPWEKSDPWVYGDLVQRTDADWSKHCLIENNDFNDYRSYEVDPETVGQFTGLLDKNNEKIFEGDLLNTKTTVMDNWADRRMQKHTIVTAVCIDGCFVNESNGVCLKDSIFCIVNRKIDFEIIGNVYDNLI